MPKLQVALDLLDLDRALQISREAVMGGADWIEVGTPLIKSEGMDAIRRIRKEFPHHTILADMKTMDTGALEVEMAAKAGANIVIMMGAASDSTIQDGIRAARKYGAQIMADLLNVPDPVERAKQLESMGVDHLCVHVGIDQQMLGMDPIQIFQQVRKEVSLPIAVAGGIDSKMASYLVSLGADVIIVGGHIVRSADPAKSAAQIKQAMLEASAKLEPRDLDRELFQILEQVSTPNISDAMHRAPAMKGIKPLFPGIKLVGRAITVQTFEGDWAKVVEAIDLAGEHDVLVVYAGGKDVAVWGELATRSAINRGIRGVVIDGGVRDVDDIIKLKFPVFASKVIPNAGEPKGFGEINSEITCGGIKVKPGDIIVGDDHGVMVLPRERAYEIARRALEVKKAEDRVREEIRRGATLSQVLHLYKWEKLS